MEDRELPLPVVLIVTVFSAYWPALLAYSVIPSSMRLLGTAFLPGMWLGFLAEILGNVLARTHMLPNDGVALIVGGVSTVVAMVLGVGYGRRGRLNLVVSSCAISVMSVTTWVLFRCCNG
ncbi:MAG: hypothetical protein HN742_30545 [Lentisphaerae bacterium]|jgi:hypothetical protein|nr:hypothetical protein [Lentisphaerota bacterium]MBT4820614.1 hypothetical protein [Lentisphaerota bacterium]MBT5612070.1 hypothetical protein [Lentisphaerota bacterium]MBT7061887.1 hypothetical protein [Lentisphaerota bacterium]MBT7846250.1 hypothetical protein [Lentisphaerota bacterium]